MPTISQGRERRRACSKRKIVTAMAALIPPVSTLLPGATALAAEQRQAAADATAAAPASPGAEPRPSAAAEQAPSAPLEPRVLEPTDDLSLFDEPAGRLRNWGLMFDLGTMGGGMMSMVYRPAPWLRVHGGAGTNGAGPGVKLGAVVSPWSDTGWSFSLDGGHYFPGNVNGLFAAFAGSDYDDSHLLEHFDYDFATLQLGWEIERGDLLFFARGGVGLLWTRLPTDDLGRVSNLSSFVDPADGSVRALLPTLSLGIIGFL